MIAEAIHVTDAISAIPALLTPVITWPAPAAIVYDTPLSAKQLDATASVAGTFTYSPGVGTVLPAGIAQLTATFVPTNTSVYANDFQTVQLTVNRATQVITFRQPASPVKYGDVPITLSASSTSGLPVTFSVLSGPASVSGSTLTITGVGTVVVAANQPGDANYASASQGTRTVTVIQAAQAIKFTQPRSPVAYGATPIMLSATGGASSNPVLFSVLSGPASIDGDILTVTGVGTIAVAANEAGNADYEAAAQVTRAIVVNQATPAITWTAPAAIAYGTALSTAQLDATSTVAGTFAYTPVAGTVLTAGSQTLSVILTPTDSADYTTAAKSVQLTVKKATPTIAWSAPAAITYGMALSTVQLNASSAVNGSFVYTPAAGTVLSAGSQTLSVTFTPADTGDYNTATETVRIMINKAAQTINFAQPPATVTLPVAPITLSATSTSGLVVTFSVQSGPASVAGNTLTIAKKGIVVVAAKQAGNANYQAAPQVTWSITAN